MNKHRNSMNGTFSSDGVESTNQQSFEYFQQVNRGQPVLPNGIYETNKGIYQHDTMRNTSYNL